MDSGKVAKPVAKVTKRRFSDTPKCDVEEYEARKKRRCFLPEFKLKEDVEEAVEDKPGSEQQAVEEEPEEPVDPKCPRKIVMKDKPFWLEENQKTIHRNRHAIQTEKLTAAETKITLVNIDSKMEEAHRFKQANLKKHVKILNTSKMNFERIIGKLSEAIRVLDSQRSRIRKAILLYNRCYFIVTECLSIREQRPDSELIQEESEDALREEKELIKSKTELFKKTITEMEELLDASRASREALEFEYTDTRLSYDSEFTRLADTYGPSHIMHIEDMDEKVDDELPINIPKKYSNETFAKCKDYYDQCVAFTKKIGVMLKDSAFELREHAEHTDQLLRAHIACLKDNIIHFERDMQELLKSTMKVDNRIDMLREKVDLFEEAWKMSLVEDSVPGMNPCEKDPDAEPPQHGPNSSVALAKEELEKAEKLKEHLIQTRMKLNYELICKRRALWLNNERCVKLTNRFPCVDALNVYAGD